MKGRFNSKRKEMIESLAQSGKTVSEISELTGIPMANVSYYKKKYGITTCSTCSKFKELRKQIIALSKVKTVTEISESLNLPEYAIRHYMTQFKLKCKRKPNRLKRRGGGCKEIIPFTQSNRKYVESHTQYESSLHFNVMLITIHRWCKRHNVKSLMAETHARRHS